MAEEQILIRPTPPAGNAPKYYHPPQLYFAPEPYHTTAIPKHHYEEPDHMPTALENVRHAIGHAFHSIEKELGHSNNEYPLPLPRTDIRESKSHYYIDVELPGINDKRNIVLKWTGLNTLYLNANIKRQPTPEDEPEPGNGNDIPNTTEPVASSSKSPEPKPENAQETDGHSEKKGEKEKVVHLVKHERRFGRHARAFSFPVPVQQDQISAKLAYGILSITVPKVEAEKAAEHKHIDIEHAGH
ncbi:hypothetical protein SCAR479_04493 [Seiridium cardinale]|uniref:SHSP domain-containing protein n=1 Tax=Seiridium cardinale TaxID=138064 RepID=A0ABR2XXD1_9PEZI